MITYVKGKIFSIKDEDRYQLVDVLLQSGVGYQIITSKQDRYTVGSEVVFHTYLVVREDNHSLYGFKTLEERSLFNMLVSVNGIGPKIAISILSFFTSSALYSVLLSEDYKALGKVPGLGIKGAQKIVIDLKSKITDLSIVTQESTSNRHELVLRDLKDALKSLGFGSDSVKQYVDIAQELLKDEQYSAEELLKLVLKS